MERISAIFAIRSANFHLVNEHITLFVSGNGLFISLVARIVKLRSLKCLLFLEGGACCLFRVQITKSVRSGVQSSHNQRTMRHKVVRTSILMITWMLRSRGQVRDVDVAIANPQE